MTKTSIFNQPAGRALRSAFSYLRAATERTFRRRVMGFFNKRLILYRWDPAAAMTQPMSITPERFDTLAQLPETVFRSHDPQGMDEGWYRILFGQGATLWTVIVDGCAQSSVWTIDASKLGHWYIALEPSSKVIYAAVTSAKCRGMGLAPQLVRAATEYENEHGSAIFMDCKARNHSAHRAFEKVGFRAFKTIRHGPNIAVKA